MSERVHDLKSIRVVFLGTMVVTGIVDAVSYLTLGHVFTANMTGNLIFLGLATEGVPGLSFSRYLLALKLFGLGAVIGTGMTAWWGTSRWAFRAFCIESSLLSIAAVISLGFVPPYAGNLFKVQSVIAPTAAAMGFRYAIVRKLGRLDPTLSVLTPTIKGLGAESALKARPDPRWLWHCVAILAMLSGAVAGAIMVRRSVALPLFVCSVISAVCAFAEYQIQSKGRSK
jgi:uncharacterized membrane protein YoaK (UPF0700 family)